MWGWGEKQFFFSISYHNIQEIEKKTVDPGSDPTIPYPSTVLSFRGIPLE